MQKTTLFGSASGLVLLLVLVPAQPAAADTVSTWHASSGLLPNQISPPWTLMNTASTETPNLGVDFLTISTDTANELMLYQQTSPLIDTGSAFNVETRMRVASGFTSADSRAPALIAMTTGSSVGNTLFFGLNEVFFNTGNSTKGPSFAIDTSEFHTYRIDFDGGTTLRLSIDGTERLIGSTFSDVGFNGTQQRLHWGDGSILAGGTSEWQYVTHNALVPVPLPAAAWMALPLLGLVAARARRR